MNQIENFIESQPNKKIFYSDINKLSTELNFNTLEPIKLLLETIYTDYKLMEHKNTRLTQEEFREKLINLYGRCIITGNKCLKELQACHIIPVQNEGKYDIDNGLLMNNGIHQSFDNYMWSINPETLEIETRDDYDGSIIMYGYKMVNIDKNNKNLIKNIEWHYKQFKNKL
jgi:predicted restriction endonuclease